MRGSEPAGTVLATRRRTGRVGAGCALAACLALGCGSGGVTVVVSGGVTFDGRPLDDGTIVFRAPTGPILAASGPIKDGRYSLRVPPGPKLVEIVATREVGEVDPLMQVRPREQYIPDRYNGRTGLTADVAPRGTNEFDFTLDK